MINKHLDLVWYLKNKQKQKLLIMKETVILFVIDGNWSIFKEPKKQKQKKKQSKETCCLLDFCEDHQFKLM